MTGHQQLLETWFKRVWTYRDPSAIDDMFPPTGKAIGLGQQELQGPEEFKDFHSALCRILSDIEISIDKCVEEGPWVSALCTFNAISQKGETVAMSGNIFAHIEGGLITQAYNHWDFMSLWAQLGYLPLDCFEQGLRGAKVS